MQQQQSSVSAAIEAKQHFDSHLASGSQVLFARAVASCDSTGGALFCLGFEQTYWRAGATADH